MEERSIISELDENMHCLMMKERKMNVGWKKRKIFEYFNIKRCYDC